ncbi:beta-lactamase family protein [Rhodopirellula sp. JC740]|uniref:Beta-lactamase family protein n=1 Tax=Rhodopirellula halodulae TaxID=2894198 RepID=A0ABS8NM19_9BACT|nr:serine hydrolase domain-containing protein [Rhodopirellula sp. JC740]MCC9644556.1 beta-lactamase family protein [Rhodopirellula sp. JC740]
MKNRHGANVRLQMLGFLTFAAATTLLPTPASAEDFPASQISGAVQRAINDQKCPGAVVHVGFDGQTVFHEAFGYQQLRPSKIAMSRETIFDLASLTKPIATATSVMILVDEGKVDLDEPVATYLPEFDNHDKHSVTVQHLLLHTSGLIPDNSMSDYQGSHETSISNLMNQRLRSPPGTKFRYSDVGFLILGELVHRVSGQPLDEFSQQRIFTPLGMHQTGYRGIGDDDPDCATTQQRDGHWMRGEVHDPRAFALGGVAGHAGLFSTSSDLQLFANTMLNVGEQDCTILFSDQTFEKMIAATNVAEANAASASKAKPQLRSLGWDKQSGYSSNRGRSMSPSAFGHGGFTGTAMWIDPELKLSVIFLSNRVHPDGKGSVNSLAGQIGTLAADWAREELKQQTR